MAVGEGKALKEETFEGLNISYDRKGYPQVHIGGKTVPIHILVWERANGKKPGNSDIHHKDGDKLNYSLDNLELLSKSDHKRLHAGWVRQNGEWIAKSCCKCKRLLPLESFIILKKSRVVSGYCKACRIKDKRERNNASPEKRAEYLKRRRESNRRCRAKLRMEGKKVW